MLPVAIVTAVAVCGAAWGPYGGLLAGIVAATTLALLVGGDVLTPKVRLGVLLSATAAITAATVGHTWGVEKLSTRYVVPKTTTSPSPASTASPSPASTASTTATPAATPTPSATRSR